MPQGQILKKNTSQYLNKNLLTPLNVSLTPHTFNLKNLDMNDLETTLLNQLNEKIKRYK